jgi:hypothetical protein
MFLADALTAPGESAIVYWQTRTRSSRFCVRRNGTNPAASGEPQRMSSFSSMRTSSATKPALAAPAFWPCVAYMTVDKFLRYLVMTALTIKLW